MRLTVLGFASITALGVLAGCGSAPRAGAGEPYDVVIRNGAVYDGSGSPPQQVDVAVKGDRIVALLPAGSPAHAREVIDAKGMAVAPGFINVLSWSTESLIADGRGVSDTKQGVTLEVFGEGWSAVVELPTTSDAGAQGVFTELDPEQRAMLEGATTAVEGGRVMQTALLSVLITDDGRVLAGAVPASRLVEAAQTGR